MLCLADLEMSRNSIVDLCLLHESSLEASQGNSVSCRVCIGRTHSLQTSICMEQTQCGICVDGEHFEINILIVTLSQLVELVYFLAVV